MGALGDGATGASISQSGQLAFVHEDLDTNIWRLDLRRAVSDPSPNPVQVVSSTRLESNPAVSPDGRRLAFSSDQTGHAEVWISDIEGKNAAPLTSMGNSVTGSPDWSPDGRRIVFDSRAEGLPNIYIVEASGGKPVRLTPGVVPHWSSDGQWIYYSAESNGRMEVWRVASSGGAPEQITRQGGFGGILSADGKDLYFTSDNKPISSLWELELSSRKTTLVASSVLDRGYALGSDQLYFISRSGPIRTSIRCSSMTRTHEKQSFFSNSNTGIDRGVSLSPDAPFPLLH